MASLVKPTKHLRASLVAHPKGDQSWIFIGRADAEAETPILWPPDAKNWLIGKDPDAGKDWRQGDKATTEGEMVGWHHRLNGHGYEQAPGVGDTQGNLMDREVCCSPWGRKESDMTEWLNWTDKTSVVGGTLLFWWLCQVSLSFFTVIKLLSHTHTHTHTHTHEFQEQNHSIWRKRGFI